MGDIFRLLWVLQHLGPQDLALDRTVHLLHHSVCLSNPHGPYKVSSRRQPSDAFRLIQFKDLDLLKDIDQTLRHPRYPSQPSQSVFR